MVTVQIINKIINTSSMAIIEENGLDESQFLGYEKEFNFIKDHYDNYGNIPDRETFLSTFEAFDFLDVAETDDYLIDTLMEEVLYYKSVEVVQEVATKLKSNSNEAVEYLMSSIPDLQIRKSITSDNIISGADDRYQLYLEKQNAEDPWYISTGFPELDELLYGWGKGEEFAVFLARTGQGKSWVLTKTLLSAWKTNHKVGYVSPEMSSMKLGYRFDTLFKNFSNSKLLQGIRVDDYSTYIEKLKNYDTPFYVATPKDFNKEITVSKLKMFCKHNDLDILGIDGISYLKDERAKRGDNRTANLTNISEDLIALSNELEIPIIVVVQSNRGGVNTGDEYETPDIEHIRDSDGIAHNATKIISLGQSGAGLQLDIKKHRDGENGGRVTYYWNIDEGEFNYIPETNSSTPPAQRPATGEPQDTDAF